MTRPMARVRVLIVDDSALVREALAAGLARFPDIEVVGQARDPFIARDLLVKLRPDVLTLDIEMPKMDGLSFLRRVMAVLPTPTIVLSSLAQEGAPLSADARAAGAVAVVAKPMANVARGLEAMVAELALQIRKAARTEVARVEAAPQPNSHGLSHKPAPLQQTTDMVIGIGASTGGVAALGKLLPKLSAVTPGIVVVQHMPAGFSADFAARLDTQCVMRVAEAKHGDRVLSGHIMVAPGGDQHLEVHRVGGEYRIALVRAPLVSGHVPSVDALFLSLAAHVGANAVACLLTGMGADGAAGMLAVRRAGGRTVAQDRGSCAVWGMPQAAEALGAAELFLPLERLPKFFSTTVEARAMAGGAAARDAR